MNRVPTLGERNMEDFFLGSFKSVILATIIVVDISMHLVTLKVYGKKNLACRTSHSHLPPYESSSQVYVKHTFKQLFVI